MKRTIELVQTSDGTKAVVHVGKRPLLGELVDVERRHDTPGESTLGELSVLLGRRAGDRRQLGGSLGEAVM